MKMMKKRWGLLGLTLLISTIGSSREWVGERNRTNISSVGTRAASCAPASQITTLQFNNVSALIENSGLLWMNRSAGADAYFVPKSGTAAPIFAGALWLGGEDINNQLKLAATRFRANGDDFWPGPLGGAINPGNPSMGIKPFGSAVVDDVTCKKWDKFFIVTRSEVEQYAAWYECSQDPLCDLANEFPGYEIPDIIKNWGDAANGDLDLGQDQYLAPFYDNDADGFYDYTKGDYPWYDLKEEVDCRTSRQVTLFGDYTIWWIFNDKGNVHTETGGDPIGMEIRAQAFAFATNDEINNMTFYNYELVNRSTQTLYDTYFGKYVDTDLGCAQDDYVGCDVGRGLGFAYNGDPTDDGCSGGQFAYSGTPPAIGIDFFEGPYQDNDTVDNPVYVNGGNAAKEAILGNAIGYGDGVIDNERFGMRRFVYYNNTVSNIQGDPDNFVEYYNFLTGRWKNGQPFVYGGTGVPGSPGATSTQTDFCFPSDPETGVTSDPEGWGTGGVQGLPAWNEVTENNPAGDRRILQSAGPFTLQPGALNNITVGVVYGRGSSNQLSSISKLKFADDKAQRLFDNCFQILEGPDAPKVTIQELDKELILMIDPYAAGGDIENYIRKDPNIVLPLDATGDEFYRFEGYQIYQMKDGGVSISDIRDIDQARLVAQVDLKNGIKQLINYEVDPTIDREAPAEMVNGTDDGLKHSFRITRDLFATGDDRLINHKTYYYVAIAYGYNNFKTYDPTDPNQLDGQKMPYIPSRTSYDGGEIKVNSAIPHIPSVEKGGTVQNANYGDGVEITRIEGRGNGGNALDLTETTRIQIAQNYRGDEITYKAGKGPIQVKVVDPLNLIADDFEFRFTKDASGDLMDSATWQLIRLSTGDTISSDKSIAIGNEQVFPDYGFSITIGQYERPIRDVDTDPAGGLGEFQEAGAELIEWSIEYNDPSKPWLSAFFDQDGNTDANWIRSGTQLVDPASPEGKYNDWAGLDDEQEFEGIGNGAIAPFRLLTGKTGNNFPVSIDMIPSMGALNSLAEVRSVDIVFTSNKDLWTRSLVLEAQDQSFLAEGGSQKLKMRNVPSVDKSGRKSGDAGYNATEGDAVATTGMGWFPGYAIDIETGERLNIAFAEDSYQENDNGRDMKFNPTSTYFNSVGDIVAGGKHFMYVFRNNETVENFTAVNGMGRYDGGNNLYALRNNSSKLWGSCMWAGIPMTAAGQSFLSTDAVIKIRVKTEYERFATKGFFINDFPAVTDNPGSSADWQNEWYGLYRFNTGSVATQYNVLDTAKSELDLINVVPNPYYAYSNYETSRTDNRVKITNLPDKCTVRIYSVSGGLVRTFTKDDQSKTSIDWDLKNFKGVPIAGGVYIVHIEVPGVGEKIVKWFGSLRPPDLKNF